MTAVITCTQGDFQYIDEWIIYHHNLGVDLFLIGFNGDSKDFDKLPKYDYVRYFDFSVDDNRKDLTGQFEVPSIQFYTSDGNDTMYELRLQQKVQNMLFNVCRYLYPEIHYCAVIDIDEFIDLKFNETNLTNYLNDVFADNRPVLWMYMDFYADNGFIYNDKRSVIDRFRYEHNKYNKNYKEVWFYKMIINLWSDEVKNNEIHIVTAHTVNGVEFYDNIFDPEQLSLSHFYLKSLEEFIESLDNKVNRFTFDRYHHQVVYRYFMHNIYSDEKMKAIPELLKKYNIDIDPTKDEHTQWKHKYIKVNNG